MPDNFVSWFAEGILNEVIFGTVAAVTFGLMAGGFRTALKGFQEVREAGHSRAEAVKKAFREEISKFSGKAKNFSVPRLPLLILQSPLKVISWSFASLARLFIQAPWWIVKLTLIGGFAAGLIAALGIFTVGLYDSFIGPMISGKPQASNADDVLVPIIILMAIASSILSIRLFWNFTAGQEAINQLALFLTRIAYFVVVPVTYCLLLYSVLLLALDLRFDSPDAIPDDITTGISALAVIFYPAALYISFKVWRERVMINVEYAR